MSIRPERLSMRCSERRGPSRLQPARLVAAFASGSSTRPGEVQRLHRTQPLPYWSKPEVHVGEALAGRPLCPSAREGAPMNEISYRSRKTEVGDSPIQGRGGSVASHAGLRDDEEHACGNTFSSSC